MTSATSLGSELINKIALDFANATGLAVVVVNIHGEEISERFNFTAFCQKLRQYPEHYSRCKMSDRCGGLEASKSNKPCIYNCHAGLTDFSIPLVISGNIIGFVLCGQVRLRDNPVERQDDPGLTRQWLHEHDMLQDYDNIPLVDHAKVIASAELLKLIVDNCIPNHLNFVIINDSPAVDRQPKDRAISAHDSKIKKALRYIDTHFSEDLKLEEVAAHVYLSPYYFSKLFKKNQGIGFNTYLNRQRMSNARQMLQHSDWSIANIARQVGFSQTSYFCKVFRQTYQLTPQMYREQQGSADLVN